MSRPLNLIHTRRESIWSDDLRCYQLQCVECLDWWPATDEFWPVKRGPDRIARPQTRCHACWSEQRRRACAKYNAKKRLPKGVDK